MSLNTPSSEGQLRVRLGFGTNNELRIVRECEDERDMSVIFRHPLDPSKKPDAFLVDLTSAIDRAVQEKIVPEAEKERLIGDARMSYALFFRAFGV